MRREDRIRRSHRIRILFGLGSGWVGLLALPALGGDGFAGFSSPIPHFTGDGPNDVAIGDLNGDGTLDLAAVNHWGDTVTILKGDGDCTFTYKGSYATTNAPQSIAAADLDGDGDLDLAIVGEYNTDKVGLMFNNGNAHFSAPVLYATGNSPRRVAMADLNGDGDIDVIVGNRGTADVSILWGNGDGTLQPQIRYPIGGAPHDLRIADLNGDGHPDIGTANWGNNQIAILMNTGEGDFETVRHSQVGNMPFGVGFADFNHDGIPDAATANFWDGTVSVLLGNGDGSFQPFGSIPIDESNLEGIITADFNLDGNADIVVINGFWYTVSVLLGNGDGTFQPRSVYSSGSFPRGISMADFDADGDLDLAISNLADDVVSALRNLTPQFEPADLMQVDVAFGTHLSGGLAELGESDDAFLRARSASALSAFEPNLVEVVLAGISNVQSPECLTVGVESRLDTPGGTARLRLKRWSTGTFVQVDQHALGTTESMHTTAGIDATKYVRASDGRIELSIRHSVVATFSPMGFESWIDLVELLVN